MSGKTVFKPVTLACATMYQNENKKSWKTKSKQETKEFICPFLSLTEMGKVISWRISGTGKFHGCHHYGSLHVFALILTAVEYLILAMIMVSLTYMVPLYVVVSIVMSWPTKTQPNCTVASVLMSSPSRWWDCMAIVTLVRALLNDKWAHFPLRTHSPVGVTPLTE